MAEQIVPQHVPREELRTEAPKQRDHDDKYVTAFVSGRPDVDITPPPMTIRSGAQAKTKPAIIWPR